MSSCSSSSSSLITAKPSARRGGTPEPGGAIDTKSLPTVGSMISKFDGGQGPQRGRAGGRSRISADERKRSRSLDGRNRSGRDSLLGGLDVLLDTPPARAGAGARPASASLRRAPPDRLGAPSHPERQSKIIHTEQEIQTQLDVEAERQKVNATVRTLQRQLEESSDESSHWRELLQKSKEELRSTKRELLQACVEKEELEEELQEVRGRFASMQVEVDSVRSTVAQTEQAERLEKAERRQLESSLREASEAEEGLALVKRSLEAQLQEAQRSLARLRQEKEDLGERLQEEVSQREELRRGKSELEEQKRLLDRTVEKLNKELDRMTEESRGLVTQVQAQLEEFKEKSRKDLLEVQRQGKERGTELERAQGHLHRNQEEVRGVPHRERGGGGGGGQDWTGLDWTGLVIWQKGHLFAPQSHTTSSW
ncbi:UNVERIFIED_CONTAM: hypothetical protein FKN15_011750 [Acipenser sinensis]